MNDPDSGIPVAVDKVGLETAWLRSRQCRCLSQCLTWNDWPNSYTESRWTEDDEWHWDSAWSDSGSRSDYGELHHSTLADDWESTWGDSSGYSDSQNWSWTSDWTSSVSQTTTTGTPPTRASAKEKDMQCILDGITLEW